MSKGSAIVGFLLCFMAGMAVMWGVDRSGGGHGATASADISKESAADGGTWSDAGAAVPVDSNDPVWGNRDAPVTIVVYSDYQCPYCSRAEDTLNALKQKYGPDKLRFVWKNFPLPFHKQAMPAHVAGQVVFEMAGSDAFWKFHDLAFQNNKALTPANFEAWASQAGVKDIEKFKKALAANQGEQKVQADIAAGKKVGVRGTPAFFINGKFLSGARPQPAFEKEIDAELAAAQQMIASGTPKDQVYVKLSQKNFDKSKAAPADKKEAPKQDDKTVWKVQIPEGAAVKGSPEALVTIVEFSEFQCPFCNKVIPTIKQVQDTYGDKVRIAFLDNPLPFHKRALPASMLAHEAMAQQGTKGFWKAHDLLFENQKKLEDEDLLSYAGQLGLDVEKAKAAIQTSAHKKKIQGFQSLASDFNASGTPHFFINGRRIVGAQPFAKFKEIIDEEIAKAQKLVAAGTPAKDVYAALIKDGKEPPPPEMKEAGEAPADAPKKGAENPKVVIHEFSDFQCPFCSRVNGTMKQIMDDYSDVVQVVWRHKPLPFHKDAPLAHQAAQEAYAQKGDAAFWKMHDKLFANQKALKKENLVSYANELGLDAGKFSAALEGGTHKAFIDKENELSNKVGVRGTPGFVIAPAKNKGKGYFLSGAQPYAKFKQLIERAISDQDGN